MRPEAMSRAKVICNLVSKDKVSVVATRDFERMSWLHHQFSAATTTENARQASLGQQKAKTRWELEELVV